MTMLYARGITRSVISARVGDQFGVGKVEVKAAQWVESVAEATTRLTGNPVDVFNPYEIEIPDGSDVAVAGFEVADPGLERQLVIVGLDQRCSVVIPGLKALYFLTELPRDPKGLEIDRGAWIDIPSNVHAWPEGVKQPEQVLCRSSEDPKHYKLYKYRREIEGTDWEDTGLLFGGTFTAESWDRFAKRMASILAIHALADEEGS